GRRRGGAGGTDALRAGRPRARPPAKVAGQSRAAAPPSEFSRRVLGVLPSPLWGGDGGGGPSADHRTTPTPALRADPPHKGEGRTEFAARAGLHLTCIYPSAPGHHRAPS